MGPFVMFLVSVSSLIYLVYFVILDYEVDFKVHIILGRPFLGTGHVFVATGTGKKKFLWNDRYVNFNVYKLMKQPKDMYGIFVIDTIDNDALVTILRNFLE